jgi:hypothetical protein
MGKPLSKVKKYSDERKWEDDAQWIEFPDNKQVLLRVVGDVRVMARHWVKTQSNKMFPMWCPQFEEDEETFISKRPCPAHEDFEDRAQKVLIGNAIIRQLQERGDENPVRAFLLSHAVMDEFNDICEMIKADPADPKHGVDLAIRYNSKAVGNKKYGVQRANNTPLTKVELAYDYYDFDTICPDFNDPVVAQQYARAMKESMARQKHYVIKEQEVPSTARDPFKYFRGDVRGQPWTDFVELVDFKNETAERKHKVSRREDDGAEERLDDDDEPKRTRALRDSKRTRVRDDDADDEEPDRRRARDDDANESKRTRSRVRDDIDPEDDEPARKRERDDDTEDEQVDNKRSRKRDADVDNDKPDDKVKRSRKHDDDADRKKSATDNRHPDDDIGTKEDDELGVVPECYLDFSGQAKCSRCPVRQPCITNTDDDF